MQLDGIWRLVESRAWGEDRGELPPPYGACPMGQIMFANGRMLAVLCTGDSVLSPGEARNYSSYGGSYTFDGHKLETLVDVSSDPQRIGSRQVRDVEFRSGRMILRPPLRGYAGSLQQRELVWEQIWDPRIPAASSR